MGRFIMNCHKVERKPGKCSDKLKLSLIGSYMLTTEPAGKFQSHILSPMSVLSHRWVWDIGNKLVDLSERVPGEGFCSIG